MTNSLDDGFVHLHVHTDNSMLDGATRVDELAATVAADDAPAVAVTDHGVLHGIVDLFDAADDHGITAIPGMEAYVAAATRHDKERTPFGDRYYHQTILAENNAGWANLSKLSSRSFLEGYWYKARHDAELLEDHADGLIVLSGCLGGKVAQHLLHDQYEEAVAEAAKMRDLLGADNYLVEVMDHSLPEDKKVNPLLFQIADDLGLRVVATNDSHYTNVEDHDAHDALLCVQTGAQVSDPDRFQFSGTGFHLRTAREMRNLWSDHPEVCDTTLWVAERVDVSLEMGLDLLPRFDTPEGVTTDEYLRSQTIAGAKRLYGDPLPDEVADRIDFELSVINDMGFCCPPGTSITMADGTVKAIEDVEEGDIVVTDEGTGEVDHTMVRPYEGDLISITSTGNNDPLLLTPEHPVLTVERGWVLAGEVEVGEHTIDVLRDEENDDPLDLLSLIESLPDGAEWDAKVEDGVVWRMRPGRWGTPRAALGTMPEFIEPDEDLLWLIGLYVADGNFTKDRCQGAPAQIQWTLNASERHLADRLRTVCERYGSTLRAYEYAGTQAIQARTTNHPLALLLAGLVGSGSHDKALHPWLMGLSPKWQESLLEGWHDGDGNDSVRPTGTVRRKIATVSPTLAYQAVDLLRRAGFIANKTGHATGENALGEWCYQVSWVEDRRYGKPHARRMLDDGRIGTKVRSVERVPYEGNVYNFAVLPQHSYVANGRVVHNCDYFLITQDFIDYARRSDIAVGPGRGSAGGSVVAYSLGITRVDPLFHDLYFERFLNPGRKEMPDIDIDFDDARRGEMIDYSRERYGDERVSQVVTFGTIKGKSGLKDAARVLGYSYAVGDRLTKKYPPATAGKEQTLSEARNHGDFMDEVAAVDAAGDNGDEGTTTLDLAEKFEGLKRQTGVHPAAVIIGRRAIADDLPLMVDDKGLVLTQWDYPTCERIGALKMDFLGLRNLGVIQNTQDHIRENHGVDIDVDDPEFLGDMDDPKTFEMLSSGDTLGVFQLDSSGMQDLVRRMRPDCFEDISAALALYRPGPMSMEMHTEFADRKNGRSEVSYLHPDLKPILGNTYAILVYQEQVMRIATDLAGFSMAEADGLRKAVGKKKAKLMASFETQFVDGAVANGYDERLGRDLWDLIVGFAAYGFNKAHTVGYAIVSYQTAWLKAHYPVEYLAALLTSVSDNKDTKPVYLAEAKRMGIDVLPPDVNESLTDFSPVDGTIRFGFSAVKGIGTSFADAIVAERHEGGPFVSLDDFCIRMAASHGVSTGDVQALAKAGGFGSLELPRKGVVLAAEQAVSAGKSQAKAEAAGQDDLFSMFDDDEDESLNVATEVPDVEFERRERLALERDVLTLYVSDHPLNGLEKVVATYRDTAVADLVSRGDGSRATLCGVVTALTVKTSRRGDQYATGTVEDETGTVDFTLWPTTYRVAQEALAVDAIVSLVVRAEVRDDTARAVVDVVRLPDTAALDGRPLMVTVSADRVTSAWCSRLYRTLANHPGGTAVRVRVVGDDGDETWTVGEGLYVDGSDSSLWGALRLVADDVGWPEVAEFGEVRDEPWRKSA